ncbi:uncharacterized protein LOC143902471 isoform X2 [Temnothorax americanus]|uniref:uncharacterized protein LOC143902471 isoform X2 n=1 Tax=Temnothorax americanus TaxID=1964332 RepID=UPI0040686658
MSDDTDDREFIRNTLTEWKLSKWYNRFIEEDIDKEAFLSITETEVSRIITTIGGIRCFLEKRKLLMDGIKLVNIDDPLVHNTCDAGESSSTNNQEKNDLILIELPSNLNSPSDSDVEAVRERDTSKRSQQDIEKENRTPKRLCQWFAKTQYQNLNLEQILQEHIKGDAILFYYKQHGFLNAEARGILLDIVANYMLKINKKPSSYEFGFVSKKICEVFPTEAEDTYYYLPFTNGPSQKNAAGKLVDKVRNTKSLLKKLGVAYPSRQDDENDSEEPEGRSSIEENDETVEIAVRWLKISREPWPDILRNWEITYDFRQKILVDNKTDTGAPLPISDYYEEWEVLSLPQGYTLLELDFRKKYPEKDSVLVFAWERYMPVLKQLMKAEIKDIYGKKLLKKLNDEKLSLESASALTLFLLPHMIPPRDKIKCHSGEKLKANVTEARNAFILQASVPGDLIPAIKRRQEVALKLNKRVQPFIAVVGASVEKFDTCYVVIDNIKYKFNSIVKAFDVCFKAIHSLNTEYSYEAKGAWLFVQQALYGISTPYDKKNSAVAALVKSFQAVCNTSTS